MTSLWFQCIKLPCLYVEKPSFGNKLDHETDHVRIKYRCFRGAAFVNLCSVCRLNLKKVRSRIQFWFLGLVPALASVHLYIVNLFC